MQLFCIAETMEEERKNSGVSCKKNLLFFLEKKQEREERKSPHHQGIRKELMQVWENIMLISERWGLF